MLQDAQFICYKQSSHNARSIAFSHCPSGIEVSDFDCGAVGPGALYHKGASLRTRAKRQASLVVAAMESRIVAKR
ncbi:hypothetical protein TNCV_1685031 [Trichonephila clavipes]|nr:hypothetical protein TNCV_1685031 [Trichonephila clavipes]